jgi:drug/metabolite transporter (DMT)-like permease
MEPLGSIREIKIVRTIIVLLAGITSISFASIFIRFCDDVPAIMISTYRLVIASSILLVIFKIRGYSFKNIRKRELLLSLLGGVFLSLHFITWIASLKYTSVANSVVLVNTNPIFVGIFSYLFLKEKQNIELVIGIILSLLGGTMIALSDTGLHGLTLMNKTALSGDGLALAGAVMASGYLIVGSKVRARLDILTYVTVVYSISAILLLITSLLLEIPFEGYKKTSYLYMVLLAIVPQLIGHTSINWALKHIKTSMVAITILGEPVGATILAYMFFNEMIDSYQFIGMILIFAAIVTASRRGKKLGDDTRSGAIG